MHRSCLILSFATFCLMVSGCAPKKAPSPQPEWPITSPESVTTIREAYHREYPNSRIGVVSAVRAEDHLVAIGDVPGNEFQLDQIVTFIDSQQHVLTTGKVIRILPDGVHVAYDSPVPGKDRAPHVGDLAVRF